MGTKIKDVAYEALQRIHLCVYWTVVQNKLLTSLLGWQFLCYIHMKYCRSSFCPWRLIALIAECMIVDRFFPECLTIHQVFRDTYLFISLKLQ